MIVGTTIYCFGIVFVLDMVEFYAGGVTGIAQILANVFKQPYLKSIIIGVVNLPLAKSIKWGKESNIKEARPLIVHAKTGVYPHILLFLEGYDETKICDYISDFAKKYGDNLIRIEDENGAIIYQK